MDLEAAIVRMRTPAGAGAALAHPGLLGLSLVSVAGAEETTYFQKIAAVRAARVARKEPPASAVKALRASQAKKVAIAPAEAAASKPPVVPQEEAPRRKKVKAQKSLHQRFDEPGEDFDVDGGNEANAKNKQSRDDGEGAEGKESATTHGAKKRPAEDASHDAKKRPKMSQTESHDSEH